MFQFLHNKPFAVQKLKALTKKILTVACLVLLLFIQSTFAANMKQKAYVYQYPNKSSKKIDWVQAQSSVKILRTQGFYAQIQYFSQRKKSQQRGWVVKTMLNNQTRSKSKTAYSKKQSKAKKSSSKKSYYNPAPSSSDLKNQISIGPKAHMFSYLIRSQSNLPFFAYDFSGYGGQLLFRRLLMRSKSNIGIYFNLNADYSIIPSKVNLLNPTSNLIRQDSSKQSLIQVQAPLDIMFADNKDVSYGLRLSYQWDQFSGDDIYDVNSVAQNYFNAFVNHTAWAGIQARINKNKNRFLINANYAVYNQYKDQSVQNIKNDSKLKLAFKVGANYTRMLNEQSSFQLNYAVDYRNFESQQSFSIFNKNFQSPTFEYLDHSLGILYGYHF